jgi:hypothetical protein
MARNWERDEATSKVCCICKEERDASYFRVNGRTGDGLEHWCEDCYMDVCERAGGEEAIKSTLNYYKKKMQHARRNAWRREHYQQNKKKILKRNKAWRTKQKKQRATAVKETTPGDELPYTVHILEVLTPE